MIDLHTHILPETDDGSESIEDSVRMAKLAVESGVHTLIVTPHCNVKDTFDNYYDEALEQRFQAFSKALRKEELPLTVVLGMEVFGTEEVPELLWKGKLITLNHSRYLLIEFGFREDLPLVDFLINEITDQGYCPIIAHPERYPFVQRNPYLVYDWLERGCSLQVNKGSILGSFGRSIKNTSMILLEHNLVSFVASDAHGPHRRTTDLSGVRIFLEDNFTKEYADLLLEDNPRCVIENRELADLQPACRKEKRWLI
jgi:protein-tyrosine phosphatase